MLPLIIGLITNVYLNEIVVFMLYKLDRLIEFTTLNTPVHSYFSYLIIHNAWTLSQGSGLNELLLYAL
jgi:hypothetical protein